MKLDIEEFYEERRATQVLTKILKPQRTRYIKIYIQTSAISSSVQRPHTVPREKQKKVLIRCRMCSK